ncbi:MAG: hypothetical protein H0T78_05825, partial [Longispora sp.]|nr:hypothetical protein [Longispora sp. (in: high G+C Gram-positive bacteria)]
MSQSPESLPPSIAPERALPWRRTLRRIQAVLRQRPGKWRGPWSYLVPVVLAIAGTLFAASATTARGTNLRNDRQVELAQLIDQRHKQVTASEQAASRLRQDLDADTARLAGSDAG